MHNQVEECWLQSGAQMYFRELGGLQKRVLPVQKVFRRGPV